MDKFRFETKNGEMKIAPRPEVSSYFYKFDQMQGIIANPGQARVSKEESCYIPASQLIKRNSN